MNTLNQRSLGAQFIMNRDGKIYRALPDGAKDAHILPSQIDDLSNANSLGMEVVAKDDKDITPAQVSAARAFARTVEDKYPGIQFFGHGEVNPGHKQPDEGKTITDAVRADLAAGGPVESPAPTRGASLPTGATQPPDLTFQRMIGAESGGDPSALSPKGAMGVAQLIPSTVRLVAGSMGRSDLVNMSDTQFRAYFIAHPDVNAQIGSTDFHQMLAPYNGDQEAAVVAYNAGPARADAWLKRGKDDDVLPSETIRYKAKVLGPGGPHDYGTGPGNPSRFQMLSAPDLRLAGIPFEKRLALANDIARYQAALQANVQAQQTADHNAFMNTMELGIHDGKVGLADIQQARESGRLTQYADIDKLEGIIAKRDGQVADISRFNAAA